MMSFSHTTVGERGGVLCPNLCNKVFLTFVQEDFCFCSCSDGWNPNEGSLFWASPVWKWGAERKRQGDKYLPHAIFYRKLFTGLSAPSVGEQLEPHNSIGAPVALYGAVEGKERVGKPLTPKANSNEKWEQKLQTCPCSSGQTGLVVGVRHWGSPICPVLLSWPRRAAGFFSLVLLHVPRRQQGQSSFSLGMLLQEREERGRLEGAGSPSTSGEQPGPAALSALSGCSVCTRPGSAVQAAIMQKV